MGWIVISVIALVLLLVDGAITSVFVLIMLNGYMSLPQAMDAIYLTCGGGLILLLSFFCGFGAKKLAESTPIPTWLGGVILTGIALVIVPVFLFVLTFVLLGLFGKL